MMETAENEDEPVIDEWFAALRNAAPKTAHSLLWLLSGILAQRSLDQDFLVWIIACLHDDQICDAVPPDDFKKIVDIFKTETPRYFDEFTPEMMDIMRMPMGAADPRRRRH